MTIYYTIITDISLSSDVHNCMKVIKPKKIYKCTLLFWGYHRHIYHRHISGIHKTMRTLAERRMHTDSTELFKPQTLILGQEW